MKRERPLVAIDIRELADTRRAGKANVVYFVLRELLSRNLSWQPLLYSKVPITDPPILESAATQLIGGWPGLRARWLSRDIDRRGARLSIFPTGYNVTRFMRRPYAIIVYDLVAFSPYQGTLPFWTRLAERWGLPQAARRAAHILAISEFTKQELIDRLHMPADKITVFPLAADAAFHPYQGAERARLTEVRQRYRLPEHFLLFVGTLEPRKNIARLLEAYRQLPADLRQRFPLVLAGKAGWLSEPLATTLDRLKLTDSVRHLAYVPFADLPALYSLATSFVYPALYEGFGLPPLEAMASGVPVITSRAASLPEVVGDAALLVDPENTKELTVAMARLLTDEKLRAELTAKGRRQAAQFSWGKAADIVDQTITSLLRPDRAPRAQGRPAS